MTRTAGAPAGPPRPDAARAQASDPARPTTGAGAEPPARERWTLGRWQSGIWRRMGYEFGAFILAALGFALTITFLLVGIGTAVIWIGLPILVFAVLVARGFAASGRGMLRGLLHSPAPRPARKPAPPGARWMRRMLNPLTDPQSWMNILWLLVQLILVVLTFPVALVWLVLSFVTVAGPIATLVLDRVLPQEDATGLGDLLGIPASQALLFDVVATGAVGLVFLLTLSPVLRGLTALHRMIAYGLLCSRYEEQQELERTRTSRAAGRAAESEALRRLERDLHDGPQQRLVRASMDLARAERMIAKNPEKAAGMVKDVREQVTGTLGELRELSRGIAPPILVDRGLAAALPEIAGISEIPVRVSCPTYRLPLHVETGVYYVVSEALANANKYSGADSISVNVTGSADEVRVIVDDNGKGGAQLLAGHGLAGLSDRVASLEGTLRVDSPAGAGTKIEVEIPCES